MLKKIFFFIVILFFSNRSYCADFSGSAYFSYNPHMYSGKDSAFFLKKANENFKLYESADNTEIKDKFLKESLRFYYICTKSDFSNIDCHIGLAKVYDYMGVDKYAKMEFNSAYNIDNKNPDLNYRYGDFYYKRHQLSQAQHYFLRAYNYGYSKNIDLNKKMAKIYVKLAEPQKAEQHIKIANEIQKKEKSKAVVSSVIKQANGMEVKPNSSVQNVIAKNDTVKKNALDVKKQLPDEIINKAKKIKMIDEADNTRPMYYLFIK